MAEPVVLHEEKHIQLLYIGVPLLELDQVVSVEPLFVQRESRKVLLSARMNLYFFVNYSLAAFVLLLIFLFLPSIEIFSLAVFDPSLKLPLVLRLVRVQHFPLAVRLVVLPLSIVLHPFVLVDLQTSTFLLAVDPLSSVEISIGVEHGSVAMWHSLQLLAFVSILFDQFDFSFLLRAGVGKFICVDLRGLLLIVWSGGGLLFLGDWEDVPAVPLLFLFVLISTAKLKNSPHLIVWFYFFLIL